MKFFLISTVLAVFTFFFIEVSPSANFHAVSFRTPHILNYEQSSSGLEDPSWDGGRTELEMVDVDDDGNVDIISIGDHGSPYINTSEHGIMVHFGDGAGSWSVYQNGNFGYGGVALGDVNNDGLMDAGYAMHHNYSSNDFGDQLIEVALGDGTGQNWTPWDDGLATNGESWGMFGTDFADVDNDGDLDIASNSFGSGSGIHVYINQSDGSWVQSFGFLGGNSTMDIVFGDVNSDGNADLCAANENGTVWLGDGTGDFTLADGNLPSSGLLGRIGPDLGDINGDGYQDLSWINGNGGVEVWTWQGSNTWADAGTGLPSSGDYEISQLTDMDINGTMDLVAAGYGTVTVWKGDGNGNWNQADEFSVPGTPGYVNALRVGPDADHNGYPDIVLLDEEGPWYNAINQLRFYKEASTTGWLSIIITSPGRYETFTSGSVRFIEWVSRVPGGGVSSVDLELSVEGSSGPWTTIAQDISNSGRFQWTVSADSTSADCYLRATVHSGEDSRSSVTELPFEITN